MDWLNMFVELFKPIAEQIEKLKEIFGVNNEEN